MSSISPWAYTSLVYYQSKLHSQLSSIFDLSTLTSMVDLSALPSIPDLSMLPSRIQNQIEHNSLHRYTNSPISAFLGLVYLSFFLYHMYNGKSYRSSNKITLKWHIASAVTMLSMYYLGFDVSLVQVAACLIFCITNLMLVKNLRKGLGIVVRPSYQSATISIPVACYLAFQSPQNHDTHFNFITPLHSFIFARVLIFLFSVTYPGPFKVGINAEHTYTLAIAGSSWIAVGLSSRKADILLLLTSQFAIMALNEWVFITKRERTKYNGEKYYLSDALLDILAWIGFTQLAPRYYGDRTSSFSAIYDPAENPNINHADDELGTLPGDKLGVWVSQLLTPIQQKPEESHSYFEVSPPEEQSEPQVGKGKNQQFRRSCNISQMPLNADKLDKLISDANEADRVQMMFRPINVN